MKEMTKEWLGIKPADGVIYAGYACLVPVYYSQHLLLELLCVVPGLALCLASCWMGMKPNPELGAFTNTLKRYTYPLAVLLYLSLAYRFVSLWQ